MAALATRIVATIIFIAVIWIAIDIKTAWQTLRSADLLGVGTAVLIMSSTIPLFAGRWLLVNRLLRIDLPFKQSVIAMGAAQMLTQTFPSTLGADGYRVLLLKNLGHDLQSSFDSVC
jgi:uncharacterized protein (TIRG00374 family)